MLLDLRSPELALDFDLAVMTRARQTRLDAIAEACEEDFFGQIVRLLMEQV